MVSASQGFKILGTTLKMNGRTSVEVAQRLSCGWAKFHQLKPLPTKQDADPRKRLRLFDIAVTKTVLWCSESWLTTQEEKRHLKTVQNSTLRRMVGPRRRPDEDYVSWIQRATRSAVACARNAGVRLWQDECQKRKWTWAGHVARMDFDRLAKRGMRWRDSEWWSLECQFYPPQLRPQRPHRTRWFRWEDELRRYAAKAGWPSWLDKAHDGKLWLSHCQDFIRMSRGK